MNVSPYILKLKFFFKNTCSTMIAWILVVLLQTKSEMIYPPKQVCLIIIHRNTSHIPDCPAVISISNTRSHNKSTKTCMFIHYMYADILFPLTKANPIIFERVTTHYQTLRIWIGHDAWRYHNLSALPYALPRVLLKPPTTDQPTHRPLTTYPPTHRPTNWLSSIYIKIETRF